MTYHIRWRVESRIRFMFTRDALVAAWAVDQLEKHGTNWWQIWAENNSTCWVIASSKSREEWERWKSA